MKRIILFVLLALHLALQISQPADASILLRGVRSSSPINPVLSTAGAVADTGTTMDPAADATAYDSGTNYHYASIVTSSGSYYVSMVPDTHSAADPAKGVAQNQGNPVTDVTKWRLISEFLYIDGQSSNTSDDTSGQVSTNPATAKSNPFKTLNSVNARMTSGGGATALKASAMIVIRRGPATYLGNLQFNQVKVNQAISSATNDGTYTTVTTTAPHYLVTGATITTSGMTPSTCQGTTARITVTGINTMKYANTCGSSITGGSIVYSTFYGNELVTTYGTGARPIIKFADNFTATNVNSMIWSNRAGLFIRDLDLTGDDTKTMKYSGLSGSCNLGDTITGVTSGKKSTLFRDPGVSGRWEINQATGNYTTSETLNCTSGGSATFTSMQPTGQTAIIHGDAGAHITNTEMHGFAGGGILVGTSGQVGSGDDVLIRNTFIHHNMNTSGSNGAGIDQGMGARIDVSHNTIYDNGTPGATINHNAYLSYLTDSSFRYNFVYQTKPYGNHGLIIHGPNTNVTISDNDLYNNNNAFGVNSGYASTQPAEYFRGFTIERNLVRQIGKLRSSSTVTISVGSPAVVTWTGHGLPAGHPVKFSTTGALPTGITASTVTYTVMAAGMTTDSFQISLVPGDNPLAPAVNTSGTQSGTHTALAGQDGGYGFLLSGLTTSTIKNNIVYGAQYGVMSLYLQTGDLGSGDDILATTLVAHNTFYQDTPGVNSFYIFNFQDLTGSGIAAQNNLLVNVGGAGGAYIIQKNTATTTANLTLNNNLYYSTSTNSILWNSSPVLTSGGISAIRSAMTGAVGAEAAGLYGDPSFTSIVGLDFSVTGGSIAKNAGANLSITTDYYGNPRSSTPTIGAIE